MTTVIQSSPNVADALAYAAGYYIFPVPPGEKKSYYKGETSNGRPWGNTKDLDTVRQYWTKHPNANIGVPTGADNGFWVLEFDTPEGHGVDGAASLAALEEKHGPLPATRQVQSPSDSIHFWFKHPGFYVKSSSGEIADGIDVKGDGGMVLAPPSVKPGKGCYKWLNDLPIAEAPPWLLDLVKATTTKSASTAKLPAVPIPPPPPGATPVEKAMHEAYYGAAQMKKGARNQKLNDSAFALGIFVGRRDLDEEKAIQILLTACEANGSLAENARECHGTIDSGLSAGKREGGRVMKAFHDAVAQMPAGKQTQTDAPRYLFETVSDLRSIPDQTWLVDRWIPERSVGLIYGRFSTGKSFIAFDILLHLVYGMAEWHGIKLPGVPCYGLLIAREGGSGFRRRIDAFKKHHSIVEDTDRIVFMRSPVNFGNDSFGELKTAIETSGRQFKVVVVDTVGRALPGEDINDAKNITRFMEHLQQIGEIAQGVAIGIHHENKSGDLTGSIYFDNSSDWMFHVERIGPPDDPLKQGKITCDKQKDGEDRWSRDVSYKFIPTEPNGEGSLVVDSISADTAASKAATRKLTDVEQLALKALGEVLKTSGELGGQIGGRSVTLDEWKEQCIRTGAVAQDKNTWRDLGRRQVGLIAKGRILVLDNRVRLIGEGVKGMPGNVIPMVPLPSNAVPMPPGFPIPTPPPSIIPPL
jgi:hypothetical protein